MAWEADHMTQISFKGHSDLFGLSWSDWNSRTVTWKSVNSSEAPLIGLRGGQRSNVVNLPGPDEVSVSCNVASLIVRQMGQLLARVTSLAWSGSLCNRSIHFFILYPICEGECVAMSDLSCNGDNLGSAALISSLIFRWSHLRIGLSMGIDMSDPDGLIRSHVLLPQYTATKRNVFIIFQVADQATRPLAIAKKSVKIEQGSSKEILISAMRMALSSAH